jgi:hypothetical protein
MSLFSSAKCKTIWLNVYFFGYGKIYITIRNSSMAYAPVTSLYSGLGKMWENTL